MIEVSIDKRTVLFPIGKRPTKTISNNKIYLMHSKTSNSNVLIVHRRGHKILAQVDLSPTHRCQY